MRQRLSLLLSLCGLAALCVSASAAFAQQGQSQQLKSYYMVRPLTGSPAAINKAIEKGLTPSANTLPFWRYTVVSSRDGNTYTGISLGTDPSTNLATTIPVKLVPIIFKMPDGTVYDPTQPNPCLDSGAFSDLQLVAGSPEVQETDFTFGSVDVGKTQYLDAFQRAEYWEGSPNGGSGVSTNTGHHTRLNFQIVDPIVVNVPTGGGKTWTGLGCGNFGVINLAWFDSALLGLTTPDYVQDRILAPLMNKGLVNAGTLPILLFPSVVMAIESTSPFINCCVLGYHGAYLDTNGNIQTYSPVDFDSTGAFGSAVADTSDMAHEVAEWVNDPTGGNPTPAWGHVGQVSGCQGNFEVGDPLSGTNLPPITMPNGFSYHLQELAFFSWFYGAPSLGANGWFSDNDTFTSDAGAVCQ